MDEEIIRGMSDEEYFALDRISKHDTDLFDKNPHAFFLRKNMPKPEPTDYMRLGTAVHRKLLQPSEFEKSYAIIPETIKIRRGKEWEAFAAEHEGKECLKIEQFSKINAMAESLAQTDEVRGIFDDVPFEDREVVLLSEIDGIPVKSKVDMISLTDHLIIDVKTASDASPEAFMRQAADLSYDVQAAFYLLNAENNGINADTFGFYVVENEYPYTTGIYTFSRFSDFVLAGEKELGRRLAEYKKIIESTVDLIGDGWVRHNMELPPWSKHLINLKKEREQK